MGIDKKQFWENKIEGWAEKRYKGKSDSSGSKGSGLDLGASLQFRLVMRQVLNDGVTPSAIPYPKSVD
jgi:hypothetical protein